jgi:cell division protein FtsW
VAKRVSVDRWIFIVTVTLVFIGLMMVFSASAVMSREKFGSAYTFLVRQSVWAAAGLVSFFALMNVPYQRLKHPAIVFSVLGITLFLLVAVFFLDRSHNVHRWIKLGALSFQPSELAKPALILFLSFFLAERASDLSDWKRTLLPAAVPTAVFTLLIMKQPDLGTALMCLAVSGAIFFTAGMNLRYFAWATLPLIPILYVLLWLVPWRRERLMAFLDPLSDPQGRGFHITQSLIAVATGGVTGAGLMEGKQKLFYLPEPQTDFIFAVTAEELGLLGSIAVVVLFGIFCVRGFRAAFKARDPFARYLAVGITTMIGVQALFNISVVLALLPTKGIPLPFISYGGSSLLIMLASVGVLLNITKQVE